MDWEHEEAKDWLIWMKSHHLLMGVLNSKLFSRALQYLLFSNNRGMFIECNLSLSRNFPYYVFLNEYH